MEIVLFVKDDGRECPFEHWLDNLKDITVRGRIHARLNRLRLGNFGDARSLGRGLWELRLDFGPGYRIYFGRQNKQVVVLLCAGNKSTQQRDIELARTYWKNYREQHHGQD